MREPRTLGAGLTKQFLIIWKGLVFVIFSANGAAHAGYLRPVVHVRDMEDKTLVLPLEECRTVQDTATLVKRRLGLPQSTAVAFAADSEVPEEDVDRYSGGASLLKGSASLLAGQQLQLMARVLAHVMFGNTTLGAANVPVAVEGSNECMTTDTAGYCELILPAGRHQIRIDHGMSNEGSDMVDVDVDEVSVNMEISVPASLFVYLQVPDSDKGDFVPTNVAKLWPRHLFAAALLVLVL